MAITSHLLNLKIIPKKTLGQHFLINPRILDKIVAAAEINKDDIVVEIGPGTGNLTQKLAEKVLRQGSGQAGKIIAIEKDKRLIKELRKLFKDDENVEIIEGDVLKISPTSYKLKAKSYKIVANIPYYITSRFIRKTFEEWPKPKIVVLTIQKEVAQRIMASPPKMNLLALSVQYFSKPEVVGYISRENFRPRPKVDSAIIKLELRSKPEKPRGPRASTGNQELRDREFQNLFFKIVRAGFFQKRKLLINNLAKKLKIEKGRLISVFRKINLDKKSRAENLSLNNWIELVKKVKSE